MTGFNIHPPFGEYALPARREKWRRKAKRFGDNPFGHLMISYYRKKAMAGEPGPFDVTVEHHIQARLYPHDNRTEKRALAGPQIWEPVERQYIERAAYAVKDEFIFVDAGANIGLYSLYAEHYARSANKDYRVLAVEPSGETLARLKTNITASGSQIEVVELALSDHKGEGQLTSANGNRGEVKLTSLSGAETVQLDTLLAMCDARDLSHIDVLKMDIEDHEETVLRAFFKDAPESLHPKMLIIETRRPAIAASLVELCLAHTYLVDGTTRQNSILIKKPNV